MKGFKELIKVDDALKFLLDNVKPVIEYEEINIEDAYSRISYEDVISNVDIPPYDRSAVDGYAVISSDTTGASITNPISLKVVGEITAGSDPNNLPKINKGEAMIIYTGAPMPKNADSVVMAEDAIFKVNTIDVTKPTSPYQNVSRKGEDFNKGKIIINKNTLIKPWHIGALASAGIQKIKVQKPLKIAVLSTGDEIAELNEDRNGKIINSTKPMLKSMISSIQCQPIDLGTVSDDLELIKNKIELGLKVADIVLTTGGTSIGNYDLVIDAVSRINNSKILFNGVRMRPGKPTSGAIIDRKPVIMLSGFPVAAIAAFYAFISPLINHMRGTNEEPLPTITGRITRRVANIAGVRTYLRVKVIKDKNNNILVEPLAITASGVLSTLTEANGLLIIPENVEGYDEDDLVEVTLISPILVH